MKIENIKFKAKRLDNGKWAEGSLVTTKLLGWDEPLTEIVAIDGTRYEVCLLYTSHPGGSKFCSTNPGKNTGKLLII